MSCTILVLAYESFSECFSTFSRNIFLLIFPIFIHSLLFSLEGRAWQESQLSHVTGMALAHSILGKHIIS